MAALAPASAADQTAELMENLSLDPINKSNGASEVTKKPSGVQYSSTNVGEAPIAPVPSKQSLTPLLQEQIDANTCYAPNRYASAVYYGYDVPVTEWEDYPRYVSPDGVEVPPLGVYGDMYHQGYGYAPYGPYPSPGSPVPNFGHNSQLYGPQHYQYPTSYFQPTTPTSASYTSNQIPSSRGEVSTSVSADVTYIPVDLTKPNSNGVAKANANDNNTSSKPKPTQQNISSNPGGSVDKGSLHASLPQGYGDPRFGFDGLWSPVTWFDGPVYPDGQQRPSTTNTVSMTSRIGNNTSTTNQNFRPLPHPMGMHASRPATSGMVNKMYPNNRVYGQNANGFGNGGFYSTMYDSRLNGRWGMSMDGLYKPRGRVNAFNGYGNESSDSLTELNKGPRAGRIRNLKGFVPNGTIAARGQGLPANSEAQGSVVVPEKDQYNKADFPETYSDAKFFIIKSYSEDDIHKCIKYNVWASTPHGNKKLDAAYQEATDKSSGCPVFLFFSVNTSGQFVGVAEMVGPVDFNKTLDYWQQDKWTGWFPVEWHIVKDVPNSFLKHIILENNENKPVTNSRDTQEVKLHQGLQLLKLFKEHVSKTSILDDFSFYETRQKVMQEKRLKQLPSQKTGMSDGRSVGFDEKAADARNGCSGLQKPLETVTVLKKEFAPALTRAEQALSEKYEMVADNGIGPKDAKPVAENRVVANGVAKCC